MDEQTVKEIIKDILALFKPVQPNNKRLLINLLNNKQDISLYIKNGEILFENNVDIYYAYIDFYELNKIIFENTYVGINAFIDGDDGNCYIVDKDVPFKIKMGHWRLEKRGRLLDQIYNFFEKNASKMLLFLDGNISLLK